jgi:luciferase family oxidoreductase group 1
VLLHEGEPDLLAVLGGEDQGDVCQPLRLVLATGEDQLAGGQRDRWQGEQGQFGCIRHLEHPVISSATESSQGIAVPGAGHAHDSYRQDPGPGLLESQGTPPAACVLLRATDVKGLPMRIPLSILDLAPILRGQSVSDSIAASVALAQRAEEHGYQRVWYAEHHNMPTIASSATSVLIAHVGAQTSSIRLGSGGVMLPNHSPLTIAEQFGTLDAMYPGRIDLGLGRAPGSDQNTTYALRRDPNSAESFPQDVLELQAYLTGASRVPGVDAIPGKGSNVPLYILGSSMFGASLAAALGLPYAFASHFAPQALEAAVAAYRRDFRPSAQLDAPYVIAGVNVVAADTMAAAQENVQAVRRTLATGLFGRGRTFTDEEADLLLSQGAGQHVSSMLTHTAVGTPHEVRDFLEGFRKLADADELIIAHQSPTTEGRLRSVTLTAEAMESVAA